MTKPPQYSQPSSTVGLAHAHGPLALSAAERRHWRALAHHLQPIVMIGQDGLSQAVIQETHAALDAHGLIKVRVLGDDRQARENYFHQLCAELGAAPVQHIGKLLVLWRPMPEKAKGARSENPGLSTHKIVVNSTRGGQRPQVKRVLIAGNERITFGGKIKRSDRRTVSPKKRQAD